MSSFMRGAAITACLAMGAPQAFATCGSANCFLITGTSEGVGVKGVMSVDLSYRFIPQTRKLDGTESVAEVLTPRVDFDNGVLQPDHHREIGTQNTLLEVDLSWGVTDRFTLATALPLINQRDHEHFDDAGTPTESFTRSDGTSGFGDARIGGRYAFLAKSKDLLVGSLTLELPTGQYRLLDSEGEINEPTIQPGSGSYDEMAGAYFAHQWIPLRCEYFLSAARRVNGDNPLDYRIGSESQVSAGVSYVVGDRTTWSVQANGRKTGRDHFKGDLVPSTGAMLVNVTPGFRYHPGSSASIYAFLQFPVYQRVNDAQLAPRTALLLGISKVF